MRMTNKVVEAVFRANRRIVLDTLGAMFDQRFRSATTFLADGDKAPKLRVRASRMHKKSTETLVLSIGKPNWREREHIRVHMKKSGRVPVLHVHTAKEPKAKAKAKK